MIKISRATDAYRVYFCIGEKRGYDGRAYGEDELRDAVKDFLWANGGSVTISRVHFIAKDYEESGWEIATIKYPPFPEKDEDIYQRMGDLAIFLMHRFSQRRITVVTPDLACMLENDEIEGRDHVE